MKRNAHVKPRPSLPQLENASCATFLLRQGFAARLEHTTGGRLKRVVVMSKSRMTVGIHYQASIHRPFKFLEAALKPQGSRNLHGLMSLPWPGFDPLSNWCAQLFLGAASYCSVRSGRLSNLSRQKERPGLGWNQHLWTGFYHSWGRFILA